MVCEDCSDASVAATRYHFIQGFLMGVKHFEEYPYLDWFFVAKRKAELEYPLESSPMVKEHLLAEEG
jgi:hypothetical protein